MNKPALRIGLIGLDTSHVEAFLNILENRDYPYHIPGTKITAAHPGLASDFHLSRDRVEKYTEMVREVCGDILCDTLEATVAAVDAVMLLSVDGRTHLEAFERIASAGKPVFIDKPFATTMADAEKVVALAEQYGTPLMSCSSLRYADDYRQALNATNDLYGADFHGPMPIEPTQGGLFWYGIHCVEMLIATLGHEFTRVEVLSNDKHDHALVEFADGRTGSIRGNRVGGMTFGGLLHHPEGSAHFAVDYQKRPLYLPMLEAILKFFETGESPIPIEETLAVVRLIESINNKRQPESDER